MNASVRKDTPWAHYQSSLGWMGPTDLAQFAARRLIRKTRQHLAAAPWVGTRGRSAAFGFLQNEAVLPLVLRSGRRSAFCDSSRQTSVLKALEHVPGGSASAAARGEQFLSRTFRIFGLTVAFGQGRPIEWERDPVSGFRFPRSFGPPQVPQVPGSDPKYPWALSRLDSAVGLAQAAWVATRLDVRRQLVEEWTGHISSFLDENPAGEGVNWSCPMEVALRAANIAQGLRMLVEEPAIQAPHFLRRVLVALAEHNAFVETHLEDGWSVPNNHLVSNYVGLLTVAALFPKLPRAERQLLLAARGLRREMAVQVHPDGYGFEDSVPYHRLSTELFTLGFVAAKAAGVDLGLPYAARLRRMYQVVRAYCSDEGQAPQLGDNDSGRAFAWTDRPSLDHGYLMSLGAALFGAPELKSSTAPFSSEAAWLLGMEGFFAFDGLGPTPPPRTFSSAGGLHVLRSDRALVAVNAGAVGQRGVGGHSHNDRLSFELHLDGKPLVVDAGTLGYTRSAKLRNAFRSTRAHNTVELDGQEQAPLSSHRLFSLPDLAHCQVERWTRNDGFVELTAGHSGYGRLSSPVRHQRTFRLERAKEALVITDHLWGSGQHAVTVRWLFAPGIQPQMRVNSAKKAARTGEVLHAVEMPEGSRRTLMLCSIDRGQLRLSLEPASYSPGYGECLHSTRLVARADATLPCVLRTTFLFS